MAGKPPSFERSRRNVLKTAGKVAVGGSAFAIVGAGAAAGGQCVMADGPSGSATTYFSCNQYTTVPNGTVGTRDEHNTISCGGETLYWVEWQDDYPNGYVSQSEYNMC